MDYINNKWIEIPTKVQLFIHPYHTGFGNNVYYNIQLNEGKYHLTN